MDKLLVSSYDKKKIPYYSTLIFFYQKKYLGRTEGQTDRSGSVGIITVIERKPLIVYYLDGFCFHNWLNYFR